MIFRKEGAGAALHSTSLSQHRGTAGCPNSPKQVVLNSFLHSVDMFEGLPCARHHPRCQGYLSERKEDHCPCCPYILGRNSQVSRRTTRRTSVYFNRPEALHRAKETIRPVVFKFGCVSEPPGRLVKIQNAGPHPRSF